MLSVALFLAAKAYYVWRNARKEARWRAMTPAQRAEYLRVSPDTGCRRLDFRFAH